MQTLANYDPYAIEEIEFFVEKKTKYTTLKSILVTLGILALTVLLNLGAIEHLWLKTSELPVVSTSRRMSDEQLTSNYFCMFPKSVNSTLPRTALINYNRITNETIKTFSVTDKFKNVPEVVEAAAGRESVCYDVEGAIVTEIFYLRMLVYGLNGDEFDFIIKTYSTKEILKDYTQPSNFFFVKALPINANRAISYVIQFKKIGAIYYDQLLVDYEPEQVMGFGTRQDYATWNTAITGASHIDILSEIFFPFYLTDQYVLTRLNIAEILGRVLSWFSVFVLICAMVVSPILDFNYKLELAQKLYDNQKLNSIDISIWSYVRYLISKVKKNLFNEEVIQTAFDQLQKDIDLLNMIKRQALMKKLIKENETLNIPHKQVQNNRNVEINMDYSEVLLSKQLALDVGTENNDRQGLVTESEQEQRETPLVTEPDKESNDGFLTRFIKMFDISEVEISLIANKGEGYKTSWSTIVTVAFLCGVVWFILFAGLFELTPNYSVDTVPLLSDDTLYPQITLNPADIIFRANRTVTSNFNLSVVVLDKYENIVETLVLLSGSACNDYALGMNESIAGGWLCLNKSITLANDGMQFERKIGMRLVHRGFGLGVTNIEAKMVQYDLKQHQTEKSFYYFRQLFSSTSNFIYNSQTIIRQSQQQSQEQQSAPQTYWTVNRFDQNFQTVFKGVTIQLSSEFIRVQKTIPNIWDVINNAWGIVVVAFTVFLSKITRFLNVKQRQRITQNEENQNRNDIIAIISTQYKLINTVFHNQLKPLKYFYKTQFYDLPIKQN